MLKKLFCTLAIFSMAISLVNCSGWRLRGSDGDSGSFAENSIYLNGNSSPSYQLIEQKLTKKKALTSFANAKLELVIGQEDWQRRSVSVSRNISTAEYELSLRVNYKILDSNQVILRGPNDALVIRSYSFDENDIAGKDKEEQLIRKDMQRAIARQILQQLELVQR